MDRAMTLDEIRQAYPLPPGWEWVADDGSDYVWTVDTHGDIGAHAHTHNPQMLSDAVGGAWFDEPAYSAIVIATGMAHLFRHYLRGTCGGCMYATPQPDHPGGCLRCDHPCNVLQSIGVGALVTRWDYCPEFCPAPEPPCD